MFLACLLVLLSAMGTLAATLLGHQAVINRCSFILASASPRRSEIMATMLPNKPVEVIISNFEENLDKTLFAHPRDYAVENARCKAQVSMSCLSL